ncbi:hypothetical protein IWX49DRAFT_46935 [Phyllosticta citricarpa]|uniref:U6 small nuclear RNA (adenine-(43)-N(6))-methyltransferase n=1 Tax=Phyllosticta paracitricarpa TaxID=2016321 RepID=A0ABR1N8T2_9PEZI
MASSNAEAEEAMETTASSEWIGPIFQRDYNIHLTMPKNRLYPTPSRAQYVCWMRSLVDSMNPSWYEDFDPQSETRPSVREKEHATGLDIGTGASAIYPLLALRLRPKWFMYGTDIDTTSLEYASKNLKDNELNERCKLLLRNPTSNLIPTKEELGRDALDFVMTNPPFFSSVSEWQDSLSGKFGRVPPTSVCAGAQAEMVYEGQEGGGDGGDYAFALRLYRESQQQSSVTVQWYSVMFGKKDSAHLFVILLRNEGCSNFAAFILGADSRTRRWIIAWSWQDLRPDCIVSHCESIRPSLNPKPTDYSIPNKSGQKTQRIQREVMSLLGSLSPPFESKWNEKLGIGVCRTREIVWNRAFKRKVRQIAEGDLPPTSQKKLEEANTKPISLGMMVIVEEKQVIVRWTQGTQHLWFDSFCGFLREALRPLLVEGVSKLEKPTCRDDADNTHARSKSAKDKSFDQSNTSTRKRRKLA